MRERSSVPHIHGVAPVPLSRYVVLYLAQLGWIGLGAYLLSKAYWPSSCRPDSLLEIYGCSMRLADQRGWVESALMTWLWSTPLLLALEILRWTNRAGRK